MELKHRNEVYQIAINKWGEKSQLEMAQEEATELALAVRKYLRKRDDITFSNLVEEMADVEIMIEQIILMHKNAGLRIVIDQQKEFKINRLLKRLNENSFESVNNE